MGMKVKSMADSRRVSIVMLLLAVAAGFAALPALGAPEEKAEAPTEAPAQETPAPAPEAVASPTPAPPETAPGPAEPNAPATAAELAAVQGELAQVKTELKQLQETLNLLIGKMMSDLQDENAQLREELRRSYANGGASPAPDMAKVPRPGGELVDKVLSEAPAPPEPVKFSYTIFKEWGRSPEEATRLGAGAGTLKGMIGLVPKGSLTEDLEKLGRDLHTQYAAYDNINIEVFDDQEAAENFAQREVANPAHRVMSVSKFKATGRDVILLIDNGVTREIPF
jgi:hypothetical protein